MLPMYRLWMTVLLVSMIAPPCLAGGFTVQLQAAKDNTLYEDGAGAVSNGAGDFLFAGVVAPKGNNEIRRALLAFDVASVLPPDAVVTSAAVTLRMTRTLAGTVDLGLHRLTSDWGEAGSDAPGQEGQGTAAQSGDATWQHGFFDTVMWTAPGGDFVVAPSATMSVTAGGDYTWGSSAQMVADVQSWVDTPASNFGWLLLGDEVSPPPTAKRFNSRENPSSTSRPRLDLEFTSASLIFQDGFETGSTAQWGQSQP